MTSLFSRTGLLLLLITVLAGALRLLYLDSQGLTLDESSTVLICRQSTADFLHTIWYSEFNMVLYYMLLRAFINFGYSEWIIRLLGVLLSTATVPVVFMLGARLFSRRVGLIAALLLAVHPYHMMLAQRARSYPLLILLVSLASLCFLRAVQQPSSLNWSVFSVVSAAAVYSHFFAILVTLAQVASLLFAKATVPWRKVLVSMVLLCVLLLPLAAYLLTNGSATHIDWVQDLSFHQLAVLLYSLTLSKGRAVAYVLLWGIAAVAVLRSREPLQRWSLEFVLLWLFLPIAMVVLLSLHRPLIVERYLSICIPASVLLAAAGLNALAEMSPVLAVAVAVPVLLWSGSAIRSYLRHPEYAEGWRENSNWILQHAARGDVVIAEGVAGVVFDYYRDRFGPSAPEVVRLNNLQASLSSPPPTDVWILGSVRFNPNWKGAVPGETEAAVAKFAEVHRDQYCPVPPNHDVGETRAWKFSLCARPVAAEP
jgi:mannosyltransferase